MVEPVLIHSRKKKELAVLVDGFFFICNFSGLILIYRCLINPFGFGSLRS